MDTQLAGERELSKRQVQEAVSKAEARARREIMVLQRQSEDAMQEAEVDAARLRSRLRAAFLGEASGHEQQKREEELNIQIAAERELRLQQSEEAIAEAQARARREVFVLREQTREAMEEADAEAARLRSRLRAAFLAEPKLKEAAASTQEALGAAREEVESVKAALAKAVAASTETSAESDRTVVAQKKELLRARTRAEAAEEAYKIAVRERELSEVRFLCVSRSVCSCSK